MPSTPFHLPPSALAAWPLRRRLDVPTVLIANVVIDVEPGIAMLLDLGPPVHGPGHTLLGAVVVGALTGLLTWRAAGLVERVLHRPYPLRPAVALRSGVLGCWLHVLLDAVMYSHLRPFAPLAANPLHVPGSGPVLHAVCAALLVPALALFLPERNRRTPAQRLTLVLLALSAVGMAASAAVGGV